MSIVNFLMKVICISIPEEFFITFLILYFLKIFKIVRHDYFDTFEGFGKKVLKVFIVSVLPMALLSNLLLYFKVDESMMMFIGITSTYITIMFLCNFRTVAKKIFGFLITFLVFGLFGTIECIIYQIVFMVTNTDLAYFKSTINMQILLTIFARIIEYAFLGIVLFKKNTIVKTEILKTIIRNKSLFSATSIFILVNIIVLIIFLSNVTTGTLLMDVKKIYKIVITLIVFGVISLDICLMWLSTTLVQIIERYKNKYGKELKI